MVEEAHSEQQQKHLADNNEMDVLAATKTTGSAASAAAAGSEGDHEVPVVLQESYEERKVQLARSGQIIPAFKHSSMRAPMSRIDRQGNEIGVDRKKYHLTYIDQIEKKPLVQVHCVESYKKYNSEDPI